MASLNSNKNSSLEEVENALEEWYNAQDESFVSENGEIESWKGGDKSKVYEQIKKNLQAAKEVRI